MERTYRRWLVFAVTISLLLTSASLGFSQEAGTTEESTDASEIQLKNDGEWLWGDVLAVDLDKKELKIKHLDYETYTEKEIIIAVDGKTTYENAKSLGEIKPQDTVSVDYIVDSEGRSVAENISVEKLEDAAPSAEEATVGDAQDIADTTVNTAAPQDVQTETKAAE